MADKINANRLGLTVGYFAALMHLVLIILVALGIANAYLGWILPLHFLSLDVSFVAFDLLTAIMLLIAAFVGGYVAGWVFAYIYNKVK
jgi:hypothetical protein